MIRCIIIDDEQHCIDVLAAMLAAKFSEQVSVVASTTDPRRAAGLIAQHNPALIFVDVEMPHLTGIQLMNAFAERSFAAIFTTAHDQYALQALKTEAVDYLLKPISLQELGEAIEKVAHRLHAAQEALPVAGSGPLQKLLLPVNHGIFAAPIADIIRVEASSNYSLFHIAGKPRMVVAKTLKEYEEILVPCGFFRVHQSHLVNLKYVEYFHPAPDEHVVLTNGEKVEVSRRRKAEFLERLAAG